MPTVDRVLARWESLQLEHRLWCPGWDELAQYVHPTRVGFATKVQPGAKQTDGLYDGTAPIARDRLASEMSGNLMSRAYTWFQPVFQDEESRDTQDYVDWLQDCGRRMLASMNQSSLYTAGAECFQDVVGLGTAALYVEEREPVAGRYAGCVYKALSLADLAVAEDADERVDTLYRTFTLTAQAAARKWGFAALGPKAKKLLSDGKLDEELEFLHAVEPRAIERIARSPFAPPTGLPFASYWIELGDKVTVKEGGYHEFPFMVPRWRKGPREVYGRGPGHLALPDVRTLNEIVKNGLSLDARAIDPALNALHGAIHGQLSTDPGAINWVDEMDAVRPTIPTGTASEAVNVRERRIEQLQNAIDKAFYRNLLDIPPVTNMTAAEFYKRIEMMQRTLGPTLGRIESEFLNPLVSRVFNIMLRRPGAFRPMPEGLRRQGAKIAVEYQGPLAKNQRLAEVEGAEWLIQFGTAIQPMKQDIFDNLNVDELFRDAGAIRGVPASFFRDRDEVEAERDARAQQMAAQADAEEARMNAEAAAKVMPMLGGARAAA